MTKTLRLFMLRHRKRGEPVCDGSTKLPLYFHDKPTAKAHRNTLLTEMPTVVVSYGPDHRLFKGE
jgi:hypothetical protein